MVFVVMSRINLLVTKPANRRQVAAAMNLFSAYCLMAFTVLAFLMPSTLSSIAFPNTREGVSNVLHRRRLLGHHVPPPRHARPRHASPSAGAATPAPAPAKAAPWAGMDPVADKLWPPGCHLWSVDAQSMQVTSDDGSSAKFLRSLGGVDHFPGGYFHLSRPFDGLQIGRAGLLVQDGFALDVWVKGSFAEPRMYVLAQGNTHGRPDRYGATWDASWYLGVDGKSKTFGFHTAPKRRATHIPTAIDMRLLSPLNWHRLTVVVLPHKPLSQLLVFLNGTQQGRSVGVPPMAALHMLGNGGTYSNLMSFPWEDMYDAHVCTLVGVQEQMAAEQAVHDNALQLLADTKKWETSWAAPLRGRSVVLVGNSAKILTGTPNGKLIDSHDVVFRFNALRAAPGSESYLGRKTTFLVLGDLTQLCNCHEGSCCNAAHADALMRSLGGGAGVTVLWARKDRAPEPFRLGVLRARGTTFVSIHPQKHAEEACNEYLDSVAATHPGVTHRIPPIMPFRTGFRIVLALLFNEVDFGMIGFDLNEETNALYNGEVTSGAEGHYVAETRVLYDLMNAGLFKSY